MEVDAPLVPERHHRPLGLAVETHAVGEGTLNLLIFFVLADMAIELKHGTVVFLFKPCNDVAGQVFILSIRRQTLFFAIKPVMRVHQQE